MPERLLHRLPDSVSDAGGTTIEPTANTVHDIIERAGIDAGDFVVVIGPGPIGLLAAMTARAGGARAVMVLGTEADEAVRLAKARELGFEHVVNVQQTDVPERVLELTEGIGADLVVECSGSPAAIASTVELVRKKGRICAIGLPHDVNVSFPYKTAAFKVADYYFCLSTSYTSWEKTIHLVGTGQIPSEKIVTHKLPLDRWAEAFEAIDTQQAIKAVLIP
jgi:L-iditol 2-dehydrogenase